MPWDPTTQKIEVEVKDLRGMLRGPSNLVIPNNLAYLAENIDFSQGVAARRPGAVRLLGQAFSGNGAVTFSGTTAVYASFPDSPSYDLGTKWAVAIHFKTTGTPGGTQYVASRDVTPTTAGKKTFALSIDSSRQMGVEVYIGGTLYALTASGDSVVTAATKYTALIVREGAALSLYLDKLAANGTVAPQLTRSDLPATTVTQPGAEALFLGQNYDGTTRSGPFDGTIGWIGMFQDFASVAQLRKFCTFQQYPDPKDPRCILWAGFGYSMEGSSATIYDHSYLANNGTAVGIGRVASITDAPIQKVQALFTFRNPVDGALQNCAIVGGDMYFANVRQS